MSTVTWSTAPIPAYRLAAGDRAFVVDRLVVLTGVTGGATVTLEYESGVYDIDSGAPVDVEVPDEPVDGYDLRRPKPGHWPSGCVCVARRHPTLDGNWETVVRDEQCRGHYDWNDWED